MNNTAIILVPTNYAASEAEGVKFLRMENNPAVYTVDSGTYQFQSTSTRPTAFIITQ